MGMYCPCVKQELAWWDVGFEVALCSDLLEEKLRLGVVPEVL